MLCVLWVTEIRLRWGASQSFDVEHWDIVVDDEAS